MPYELRRDINFDPTKAFKRADLHIQTTFSDGWATPEDIVEAAHRRNLDTISITDHDTRASYEPALKYARSKGYTLEIIPGVEVTTRDGHLLAYNVERDIPRRLGMEYTLFLIHRMGGKATIPHPFLREMLGSSIGERRLLKVLANPHRQVYFDGFEIFNGGAAIMENSRANRLAADFYLGHPEYAHKMGTAVGNSDAHRLEAGSFFTAYQGNSIFEAMARRQVAIFREDRIEGLDRLNYSVDRLGARAFQDLPNFILARLKNRNPNFKVFAVELGSASEMVARQFLSNPEFNRFREQSDVRRAAYLASRMALKLAYCALTDQDPTTLGLLNIQNKIFGEHRSGPPFIQDGADLYFSLAHSGNIGLGAVADAPIGVDLERVNHSRPPRTGLLSDQEIVQACILNPDLDLHEIAQKLASVKEAVAKGLILGNSRQTRFNITFLDPDNFMVTASRNGATTFPWRVRSLRKGDYFLTLAVESQKEIDPSLNWVSSTNLSF